MKKAAVFFVSVMFLLLIAGCGNTRDGSAQKSVADSSADAPAVSADQMKQEEVTGPVVLRVAELQETFAALDLTGATLTCYGETEETCPAGAAIRAERYLEQLKNLTWWEYEPDERKSGTDGRFYRITAPGVTVTSYQSASGRFYPVHLTTEVGEGWFTLPSVPAEQGNEPTQMGWTAFEVFGDWYTEALAASVYGSDGTPLTAEELDYFWNYTESIRTEYDAQVGGYVSYMTEISCFFTSRYSDPRDMDAVEFLYYCPDRGVLGAGDEEEFQLVQKKLDWRGGEDNHLLTLGETPVPCHRLPRTYINEILTRYAGITVEEMNTDWMEEKYTFYIAETDCFYSLASDFGPGMFTPYYGEKNGDTVTLWESPVHSGEKTDMLILRKQGDNWHILSHLFAADAR